MPPRAKRKRASDPASPAGGSPAASRRTRSTAAHQGQGEEQGPILVPVKGHLMHPAFAAHRQQGLFLDATLAVGGTRIEAHKVVLATYSAYLKGLFTSGLAESLQAAASRPVAIHDVDGAAVVACVDCMYSGTIALSGATVCAVIKAANLLQVAPIEEAGCAFFVSKLEPETALDALRFAEGMAAGGAHSKELHAQVLKYVHEHFKGCVASPAFVGLSSSSVAELVGSPCRACKAAAPPTASPSTRTALASAMEMNWPWAYLPRGLIPAGAAAAEPPPKSLGGPALAVHARVSLATSGMCSLTPGPSIIAPPPPSRTRRTRSRRASPRTATRR